MEIDFDRESWRPIVDRRFGRPEWHVLRTRLHAAYEASRTLRGGLTPNQLASSRLDATGSFAARAARALGSFEREITPVNPSASANGKPSAGMKTHISLTSSGDRGLK